MLFNFEFQKPSVLTRAMMGSIMVPGFKYYPMKTFYVTAKITRVCLRVKNHLPGTCPYF